MRHTDRQTEYAALRATIRERGTVRMALVPFVFVGWAAVALATASMITAFVSLSTLIPLMVLAAGFETLYALHITVERIGRYVQVFHAESGDRWEHVAMTFGGQLPRPGIDPLFARLFILATSINFFPAALGGEPWEVVVIAVCHLALIVIRSSASHPVIYERSSAMS